MASASVIGFIIALLPAFIILLFARNKANKRKLLQDDILKKNKVLTEKGIWFRIRYCSEPRFRKFWKLFPWEATGILFVNNDKIMCLCNTDSYKEIKLEFNKEDTSIDWAGKNKLLKNGFMSWFILKSSGKNHYFSSETGSLIFNSEITTKDIYEKLINILK